MKRLINTLVFVALTLFSTNSFSYNPEPKTFIDELVKDATATLSNKSISKVDKLKKIKSIALQNVDIEALSMYTLGQARKNLNQAKLEEYKSLFESYFLKNLTSRLKDYSSQKFTVLEADQKSEIYTIVSSQIEKNSSGPEIKIDWRVYTKDPARPLVRDLIVEGLSLAKTQKEEFASILNSNNNDIDVLFEKLRDFIKN